MKVGFDAKRIFHNQRGLGSYGRNLLQGLLKYHPQAQYYLYTPKIKSLPELNLPWTPQHNLKLRTPGVMFPGFLNGLWRSLLINQSINEDKLDIYHGLSQEVPFNMTSSRPRVIVTVHDLIFLKYPQFFSPLNRKIYTRKIAHACANSDTVLAISEQTKSDLVTMLKIKQNKIRVVYQGCDEIYYQETVEPIPRSINNFQLPEKYILYVGALVPHKNAMAILKALRLMKERDYHLIIVGKGKKYYHQLQEFIERYNLSGRVTFLSNIGPISNKQLAAIYRLASLFVFPSLMEGFGIPVIEAMFSGIPVIINQQAGLSEAAGDAALEVDVNHSELLAESIDQILKDKSISKNMVEKGALHVQKFKLERVTSQVLECYQQLLY
ncbi:MAG: glycosyl transferase family 1 [Cyclobacteriaceae bacterium]|nr:MAG: glycosyl transferase family 1 [Cyclobacteriaceae bacterium]